MKALARVVSQQLVKAEIRRFDKKIIGSNGFFCRQENDSVIISWLGDKESVVAAGFQRCADELNKLGYLIRAGNFRETPYLTVSKPVPVTKQIDLSVKHKHVDEDLIRRSLLQLGFEQDNPLRGIQGFQVWASPLLETGWIITNREKPELASKILAALESLGYEKVTTTTNNRYDNGGYISLMFAIKKESNEKPNP